MKEGIISFKFKSEKEFDKVKFSGETILVSELKRSIEEKRIRKRDVEIGKKWESYELVMYEENNKKSRRESLESTWTRKNWSRPTPASWWNACLPTLRTTSRTSSREGKKSLQRTGRRL